MWVDIGTPRNKTMECLRLEGIERKLREATLIIRSSRIILNFIITSFRINKEFVKGGGDDGIKEQKDH